MTKDIVYALRQFRKNPGFAVVAILTLGMGIGAAAAMFGLIQGVLLSPPPYGNPDRLVLISAARADGAPYSQRPTTATWVAWRDTSKSLESLALYAWTFNFLVRPDGSESLGGMVIDRDYFRVLGLKPILGREFLDSEAGGGRCTTHSGDHRPRPVATPVQRRSTDRGEDPPDQPPAGAAADRRRHACWCAVSARSARVGRAQLRRERPGGLLVPGPAERVAASIARVERRGSASFRHDSHRREHRNRDDCHGRCEE